jgi:hypothetical protein
VRLNLECQKLKSFVTTESWVEPAPKTWYLKNAWSTGFRQRRRRFSSGVGPWSAVPSSLPCRLPSPARLRAV